MAAGLTTISHLKFRQDNTDRQKSSLEQTTILQLMSGPLQLGSRFGKHFDPWASDMSFDIAQLPIVVASDSTSGIIYYQAQD